MRSGCNEQFRLILRLTEQCLMGAAEQDCLCILRMPLNFAEARFTDQPGCPPILVRKEISLFLNRDQTCHRGGTHSCKPNVGNGLRQS